MSRLCEFYPGICLTTDEKAQKNLSVPSNRYSLKFFDIIQGGRIFLKVRAKIADNFGRNSVGSGKPEFTGNVFSIIPFTS